MPRRQQPVHVSFARIRARRILLAICFCAVVAAVAQVSWSFFCEAPYFKLSRLQVEGVAEPIAEELRTIVESAASRSRNMLNFDTGELQRLIAAHPRIRNFQFQKMYPDTLLIKASEREPAAIVSADGFYLVDREGFVIEQLKAASLRDYDFPYVTGIPNDQIQPGEMIYNSRVLWALDLIRLVRERNPGLYGKFSEVNLNTDSVSHLENITVRLKGGTQVRFGDKNPIDKLPTLDYFIQKQVEQNVDPFMLAYIDLRFQDQIVYMDRPTAVAAAAGVLDRLQDGTAVPLDQAKKPDKNEENKTAPVVSKANSDDAHTDEQPRKAAPAKETKRSASPEPGSATAAGRAGSAVPQAVAAEPAPVYSKPQPSKPRGLSRFAFWRRGSEPDSAPDPFGVR